MIINYIFGLTIFAALTLGAYSRSVTNHILATGAVTQITVAKVNAEAGIELGRHLLAHSKTRQISGRTIEIELNGGRTHIHFENEAGKIDLNFAPIGLVTAGLSALPLLESEKRDWLVEFLAFRQRSETYASVNQMIDHHPPSAVARAHWHRIFTVYNRVPFVNPALAHRKLREVLEINSGNSGTWTGRAVSGANTVIATGISERGSRHIQSALFAPEPFQTPPFEIVTYQIIEDDSFTEHDPPA